MRQREPDYAEPSKYREPDYAVPSKRKRTLKDVISESVARAETAAAREAAWYPYRHQCLDETFDPVPVGGFYFKDIFWNWCHRKGLVDTTLDKPLREYHASALAGVFKRLVKEGVIRAAGTRKSALRWGHTDGTLWLKLKERSK